MATLLPAPVDPAISRCGMPARSATTMRPLMSLPEGHRQLRLVAHELLRLDVFAQPDDLALAVRHLNADGRFAGHALDQNALGLQRETKIVGEVGDAAVFDSGVGLELERSDHRAGIDLRDLAVDVELGIFFGEHLRQNFQFVGIDCLLLIGTLQQAARRQFVAAGDARHGGFGFVIAVGALRHLGIGGGFDRLRCGERARAEFRRSAAAKFLRLGLEHAFDAGAARFRCNPGLHVRLANGCREGINWVLTTGFEMRRLSSSFCCRRLMRSSCQS